MSLVSTINNEPCYEIKMDLIRSPLLNFCQSRIFIKEDAQDIVNDVLFILWSKRNEYNPNKHFYAWAFNICKFQIRKYLTSNKRLKKHKSKDSFLHSFCSVCNKIDNNLPFDNILKSELESEKIRILNSAAKRLPKMQKTFFDLSFKGLSQDDIVDIMHLKNKNHYHTLKARTIFTLKSMISKFYKNEIQQKK